MYDRMMHITKKDVLVTMKQQIRGRFAPTPSGFLHLGNVFCSLLAWLHAKSKGGSILLRVEDLDTTRCPRKNADQLRFDLEWLGLTWNEGAYIDNNSETYFQSQRSSIYEQYFHKLQEQGLVYPCFCSRSELHAAEAPHLSDGRIIYPGTCRKLTTEERQEKALHRAPAYRVLTQDASITYTDGHYGPQQHNLAHESGDFIVRRSDGVFAYQLAVVVDDALMDITEVVRGCDLLDSTPMQLYLYELLGFKAPEFFHIPLLTAMDGRRLAKRDGDLEIAKLRQHYGAPEPIIGQLAYWAGQLDKPEPISVQELLPIFNKAKLPKHNIAVNPEELLK